jgi:heme exporter protein CcmD
MSNHAAFILASYLAAFVILGGLVIASLSARNRVRRELDQRGLAQRGQDRKR